MEEVDKEVPTEPPTTASLPDQPKPIRAVKIKKKKGGGKKNRNLVTGRMESRYATIEEFQARVEKYFKSLKARFKTDADGNKYESKPAKHATVTGLAIFLGFYDRSSLQRYKTSDKFGEVTRQAVMRVEQSYENHLYSKTPAGAIFALKNMGWSDRQEVEHSGSISTPAFKWTEAPLTGNVESEEADVVPTTEKID